MQYTILFDWVFDLTDPCLNVTEALTYSIIYSFSRDGRGIFIGSYKYLSRLTRLSDRQQIRVLEKLIKQNLIFKKIGEPGYANEYKCNLDKVPNDIKILSKHSIDKMSYPMTSETNTPDIHVSQMSDNNKRKINISKNKLIVDNLDKSNLSPISCSNNISDTHVYEEEPTFRQMNLAEAGVFNNLKNHK